MFYIFSGDTYYPPRSWDAFYGVAKSLEEAIVIAANLRADWVQIVDASRLAVVWER